MPDSQQDQKDQWVCVGVPVLRAGLRATSVFFFKTVFVPLIS